MLCPVCRKPIINPTWKTCESATCAVSLRRYKVVEKKISHNKLTKLLSKGCPKSGIATILGISERQLDYILAST